MTTPSEIRPDIPDYMALPHACTFCDWTGYASQTKEEAAAQAARREAGDYRDTDRIEKCPDCGLVTAPIPAIDPRDPVAKAIRTLDKRLTKAMTRLEAAGYRIEDYETRSEVQTVEGEIRAASLDLQVFVGMIPDL